MNALSRTLLLRAEGLVHEGRGEVALDVLVAAVDQDPFDAAVVAEADRIRQQAAVPLLPARKPPAETREPIRRTISREALPARKPAAQSTLALSPAPDRAGGPKFWIPAIILLLGALALLVPSRMDNVIAFRQLEDPFTKGLALAESGEFAGARAQAAKLAARPERAIDRSLLDLEIASHAGLPTEVAAAAEAIVGQTDVEWWHLLQVARALSRIEHRGSAAAAAERAFLLGAPDSALAEVVEIMHAGGRSDAARRIAGRRIGTPAESELGPASAERLR